MQFHKWPLEAVIKSELAPIRRNRYRFVVWYSKWFGSLCPSLPLMKAVQGDFFIPPPHSIPNILLWMSSLNTAMNLLCGLPLFFPPAWQFHLQRPLSSISIIYPSTAHVQTRLQYTLCIDCFAIVPLQDHHTVTSI